MAANENMPSVPSTPSSIASSPARDLQKTALFGKENLLSDKTQSPLRSKTNQLRFQTHDGKQKLSKSFDWKSSPAKSPLREKPESVISLPDLGPRSPSKCKEPTTPIPLTELKSSILTSRSEERTSTPSTFLFNNKEIRNEELQKEQNVNEQLQKELATSHERTSKMRQEVKENEARIMRKRNELASLRQTVVLLAVVEATQKRLDDLKNEIEDMEDIYSECETLKSEVEDDEETKTLETTLQKTLMDQQTRIDRFMNDIPSLIYEINQRKPKQGN